MLRFAFGVHGLIVLHSAHTTLMNFAEHKKNMFPVQVNFDYRNLGHILRCGLAQIRLKQALCTTPSVVRLSFHLARLYFVVARIVA